MQYYVEKNDPARDLGGLCECFVQRVAGDTVGASAHIHRHFELLFCQEGEFELRIERQSFRMQMGSAALIHSMEPHQIRNLSPTESGYLVLKFTPEALYSVNQPVYEMKYIFPYLHFSGQRSYVYSREALRGSRMEELLQSVLKERQEKQYGYEMAIRAYITQVLLWFIRAWQRGGDRTAMDEQALERLPQALQYIQEHLSEPISVGQTARALNMGTSSFSRFFTKASGLSFPAYVNSIRLSRAAELLVSGDASITEIALETGFSTASYFILSFRKYYQLTPAQFRKRYAAGE